MKTPLLFVASLAVLLGSFAPARTPQDPAPAPKPAQEKPARPKVYDESADGARDIAAALTRAKLAHKRVLVQWGANWCGWCLKLHELFKSEKQIAHELQYEYELVLVDIGKWDKHLDLAARYQADFKAHGVPYLTVLDEDGKLVTNQDSGALEVEQSDHHDPAKVLEFLSKHQAPQSDAALLLAAALGRAQAEHKRVFVHFSTPWCVWCRRLESWMAQPRIAALFEQDYVDLMLDAERYAHAPEVLARFTDQKPGWPWIVIVDADGRALCDGFDAKQQNIGFPSEDGEIAHFAGMLEKTRQRLQPADIAKLREALVADREERQRAQKAAAPGNAGH